MKLISVTRFVGPRQQDYRIVVERSWLFGWFPERFTLQGSSTVWNHYPSGLRCTTGVEYEVAQLMKGWEFRQEEMENKT